MESAEGQRPLACPIVALGVRGYVLGRGGENKLVAIEYGQCHRLKYRYDVMGVITRAPKH